MLKVKKMGLREVRRGLGCREVFGHPMPSRAQSKMDYKMEQKEGLGRMMAEAVVATLLPQHPSEPGATSPPAQRSLVKNS